MALDAILFDLDGTLIDTNELHAQAFFQAFQDNGYRVARDRIAIEIGKGGDLLVPAILGAAADEKDGEKIRDAWEKHYIEIVKSQEVRVFPGALELIENVKARGLKLSLATSGAEGVMDAVEASCGVAWRELFPLVVTSDDAPSSKPSPDIVSAATQRLGVPPLACAFVGDTIYDARACRSAGVVCFTVSDGQHAAADLREAGARATFSNLLELNEKLDETIQVASPQRFRWSDQKIESLMRAALQQAQLGLDAGEMPIGAVIADGKGEIIARAFNQMKASGQKTAHAEIMAFAEAAEKLDLDARDATLVTTLEPCVMCAGAAMEGAIESVDLRHESAVQRRSFARLGAARSGQPNAALFGHGFGGRIARFAASIPRRQSRFGFRPTTAGFLKTSHPPSLCFPCVFSVSSAACLYKRKFHHVTHSRYFYRRFS